MLVQRYFIGFGRRSMYDAPNDNGQNSDNMTGDMNDYIDAVQDSFNVILDLYCIKITICALAVSFSKYSSKSTIQN